MKILLKITLLLLVINCFQSCSKDDAQAPEPIAQPEPEPTPEPEPENQAPSQVSLLAPSADAQNIDVKPTFSWEAATDPDGDAITYDIYADTTATPSMLIGTTSQTSFEAEQRLSLLENYNWRVVVKDGKGGESESAIQGFDTRTAITSIATSSAEFGRRGGHSSAVFQDKLWVIGGRLVDSEETIADTNEVWNSDDGITWNLVTSSADFLPRHLHQSLVFDNKIWVFGGVIGTDITNEIWNSEDGITWNLVSNTITPDPFNKAVVVFQDKLWLVHDSVWFSDDGIIWSLAYNDTRIDGSVVVHDNKLFVTNNGSSDNDIEVNVSEDGFSWTTLENNSNELFENHSFGDYDTAVFDGKIWNKGSFNNNLLYTTDGSTWKVATDSPAFPFLTSFSTVTKDDKLWVIGGYTLGSNNAQDSVYFID